MKAYTLLIMMTVLVGAARCVSAQATLRPLPEVIKHDNPIYPALARQARIEGSVRLRITTDGHAVSNVAVLEGHPLLVKAATDSVQTWKFADHVPGMFEVTFNFTMSSGTTSLPQEAGVVDIAVLPLQFNENSDDVLDYTPPVTWDLELKTATDDIKAQMTLWTYGPWLRGYTVGPLNQERALANAYVESDMLGFDATLDDSHGQRLNFSLIGKKTADKIQGIFLDVWGGSGTWTAKPAKPPVPNCAAASSAAQENVIPVPEITNYREPEYPPLPWEAHIQGQVRMHVSTDTYCVGKITTESSEPLLAQAAEADVRRWWFDSHKPGTFNVTFNYRLLGPTVSFLEKPGVVEISAVPPSITGPRSELWNFGGYSPEIWKAKLTGPRGNVQVTFTFDFGCCEEGIVTDDKGWKEVVNDGHNFDRLGFTTTILMSNNRPTKVSLIGIRRKGDRIQGVFLDESGTSGTWSARLISHGPENTSL